MENFTAQIYDLMGKIKETKYYERYDDLLDELYEVDKLDIKRLKTAKTYTEKARVYRLHNQLVKEKMELQRKWGK